jgi:hypothetical protein
LVDWADRSDCVSVASAAPKTVAEAVKAAVGRDAPTTALSTWDDVTDRLLNRYE